MMRKADHKWLRHAASVIGLSMVLIVSTRAHSQEPTPAPSAEAAKAKENELALRQGRVADKYARLEQLMLKMAEIDGPANPKRAALLKQAVQQSKDKLTRSQLDSIVKLLDQQKLKRAIDGQGEVTTEMKALLELLLSENRADRNKGEQDRVKEYIKEVERLIRLQKDVQGRTEGTDKTENVAKDQAKLAERTGDLSKKIAEDEAPADGSGESKPGDGQSSDMPPGSQKPPMSDEKPPEKKPADPEQPGEKPAEAKPMPGDEKPMSGEPMPGEAKPGDEKPMSGEGEPMPGAPMPGDEKPGEPMPGEAKPMPSAPMPGQPMPGQPMPGQSGEPQEGTPMPGGESPPMPPAAEQAQQNPARKRLEVAQQKMKEAQQKLDETKRGEAKEAQEAARQELERAKAQLEEILRQLREEEIERTLAQLEARFRKMLELQLRVNETTQRLAAIPAETRSREVDIESGKLAVEQRKIGLEADKAYNLLLEEGSSIAFTESVAQLCNDMEQVADWLAKTKLDQVTLGVEEEIVTTLQEMIAAFQQAQKDQEKKQEEQQQQPMEPGEEQDQPLVDQIAEYFLRRLLALLYRALRNQEP